MSRRERNRVVPLSALLCMSLLVSSLAALETGSSDEGCRESLRPRAEGAVGGALGSLGRTVGGWPNLPGRHGLKHDSVRCSPGGAFLGDFDTLATLDLLGGTGGRSMELVLRLCSSNASDFPKAFGEFGVDCSCLGDGCAERGDCGLSGSPSSPLDREERRSASLSSSKRQSNPATTLEHKPTTLRVSHKYRETNT